MTADVIGFERAFDAGVQDRLRTLSALHVELDGQVLRRLVWVQGHDRYVLGPLQTLRVVRGFDVVELDERPAAMGDLGPAALLLEFACGSAWSWATDDEVWAAALAFASAVWPAQARDARHLSETVCVALAARRGVRLVFETLPNLDYPALGALTDELDRAAVAPARTVAPPTHPAVPPDPDVELSAAEARQALASALDQQRPSRR